MKKIYYIIFSFLLFSLASCNFLLGGQLIEEDDSQNIEYDYLELHGEQELVLTGRICISGAVPSELVPANSNNNARTAIPTAPAAFTYKYKINDGTYSTLTVAADNSFSIVLPRTAASVTVTVQAFTAASSSTPLLEGSITIPQTNYADSLNDNIILEPIPTGTGTVRLAVTTDVANAVTCWAYWSYPNGTGDYQSFPITPGTTGYFTMNDDPSVPAHAYEVNFIFQDEKNNVVYKCFEKVNVFGTLETDKWLNNGSIHIDAAAEGGKGSLHINQTCIDVFKRTEFFVSNTPDTQGTGTYFDPVDFKDALKFIKSINDGTSLYTICVMNNISASADYSTWPKLADETTPADSYITIDPAVALKLKITSYNNPVTPYKIDANRSAANPGRVMYIGAKAEVTLENITVTGGCSTNNGAGVYVNSGALYLNSKASVSYNKMAAASKYAAGVYNNKGTLSLGNGSEISYNGDETFLPNAGGLYSQNGKFYMEPGSEVHHNYANSGAGVKLNKPVDGYIHGAKIYSNEIKGASGNGGGLFVSSTNFVFEIKDTDIYSNKAYKGAGALVQNALFNGTTIFKENEAYTGGGGLYSSDLEITVTENVVFENNKAPDGSAIYVENKVAKNELSDSFKFVNTTELQTVFLEYDTAAETPVITLGNLTGTAADQKINLIINKKSGDNYVAITASDVGVQIISPADGSVDLSAYVGNIAILNNDLTASGCKIDSNGKLAENIARGPNGGFASSEYQNVRPVGDTSSIVAAGNYSISTKEELIALSNWAISNSSTGFTFVLYDNIDLENAPFRPIYDTTNFSGTFDGNGNKITGLNINSSTSNTGLFGKGGSCTIKNLYVEGTITSSTGTVGGIIGSVSAASAVIDNCVSNVQITCTSGGSVGGIIGNAKCQITNCINLGNINASAGTAIGGIAGASDKNIINCANFGAVTGHMNVAGICGQLDSNGIANCYNYGKITADSSFGAIEGKGSAPSFNELYYHPNSGVTTAVCNKIDDAEKDIGTFTDPEALRATLNLNLNGVMYSSLSLSEWNYNYKINGVNYPVCTNFELPEALPPLAGMSTPPTDLDAIYPVASSNDILKLEEWVSGGNTLQGLKFELSEDITLQVGDPIWTAIGTETAPFKGTFDGQGKTIDFNYSTGNGDVGLFGVIDGAIIKNVKVKGAVNSTGDNVGGIVGKAKGGFIIDNCEVECTFTVSDCNNVGGIVGYVESGYGFIRNCYNKNGISASNSVGGIIGKCDMSVMQLMIMNCGNEGQISATTNSGGICGEIRTDRLTLQNCFNQNTQCKMDSSDYCGLLIGYIDIQSSGILNIKNDFYNINSVAAPIAFGNTSFTNYDSSSVIGFVPSSKNVGGVQTTICVLDGSTTDLVEEKLNPWCESNSLGGITYTKWKYDNSGIILFDN